LIPFSQNIQPVVTKMCVVVQKMVDAECAGVLFSRHPINGDPSVMLITANFGLGESVVDSRVEPDEFLIKRSYKDNLTILGSRVGSKNVLIQMTDSTSVEEVQLTDEMKKKLCLSDELVINLARLGVIMEKFFGTPRDIEFAVTKDKKIFLLQSRPITALNNFIEFELSHENNTAIMGAHDVWTRANVGEVIQGPSSTLNISCLTSILDKSLSKLFGDVEYSNLFTKVVQTSQYHPFMNCNKVRIFFWS